MGHATAEDGNTQCGYVLCCPGDPPSWIGGSYKRMARILASRGRGSTLARRSDLAGQRGDRGGRHREGVDTGRGSPGQSAFPAGPGEPRRDWHTRHAPHTHDTLGTPLSRGQDCNTPAWWVSVLRAVLGEAARSGGGQHARHLTLIHRDSELLGRVAQRDCHYTLETAGWVPPGVPSLGVAGYPWRDLQVSRWLSQQPRGQIPWL